MKYRHQYHAGNFADVHKHVLLLEVLRALTRKDKGLLFVDTHAGRGEYELHPGDSARQLAIASASVIYRPAACDQPRGATFAAARPCAAPGTTDATPDVLARRLAVH